GGGSQQSMQHVMMYHTGHEGTSLVALRDLAALAGLPMEMRFVQNIDDIPVPSIAHLKSNHYTALVGRRDGGFVLRDLALGGETVISNAAMHDEASGYVLSPS